LVETCDSIRDQRLTSKEKHHYVQSEKVQVNEGKQANREKELVILFFSHSKCYGWGNNLLAVVSMYVSENNLHIT
jgi:hypothetical protein